MSSGERRPRQTAGTKTILLLVAAVAYPLIAGTSAANDLSTIEVSPERGQSAEQARRDRYECHNWATDQTGNVLPRYDAEGERRARRAERVDKVLTGAGIGAAIGGILRRDEYKSDHRTDGVLGGAALGAAIGAIIGKRQRDDAADEADEAFNDYFRALSACMEGRGYTLTVGSSSAMTPQPVTAGAV